MIKVAGRLDAQGLHHLLSVCVPEASGLKLDLSDLRSVDDEGCRSLQVLEQAGAEIVGEANYIRARLNEATDAEDPDVPKNQD